MTGTDPTGDPATAARRLARRAITATLATVAADGAPFASLVLVACDHDGTPILMLSDLAAHGRNIAGDDRVSLLFDGTRGHADPLTGPRVSVSGRIAPSADARHRARFLARHPGAAIYADFTDFKVYRVTVASAHAVAGFGRIDAIAGADYIVAGPLAIDEDAWRDRLAGDPAAALLARAAAAASPPVTLVGVDADGCDLRAGDRLVRLDIAQTARDDAALAAALAAPPLDRER